MPKTKEEKNAYHKEYYQKNIEKIAEKKKEYRANNKERILAKHKEYYAKNKAKIKECREEHYKKNKAKLAEKNKQYNKEYPEKKRIAQWKRRGIIDGDFDLLNEVFEKETHCWICWKPYIGTRKKCLDHDWDIKDDGNVRYICCNTCNTFVVG